MRVAPVDPRDTEWEFVPLAYRVYFWQQLPGNGWLSDECRITDEADVERVLEWAHAHADGRRFVLYAEFAGATSGPGLIQLHGEDPPELSTTGEAFGWPPIDLA